MAIYGDREERELFTDEHGTSGFINMYCDWADTDPIHDPYGLGLPRKGDLWPGTDINLRCVSVHRERYAVTMCKLKASYSTDGQITDDFISIEFGVGVEVQDCSLGWRWQFGTEPDSETDTPPEKAMQFQVPIGTMTIRVKRQVNRAQLNLIMNQVGKVSEEEFLGFVPGGVRFDGVQTTEGYDSDGYLQDASISFQFSVRGRDWRDAWHDPEIQVDENTGRDIYWQNKIWHDDDDKLMANFTANGTVNPDPVLYPAWPAADPTQPKPGTPMWITDIRGGYIEVPAPVDPEVIPPIDPPVMVQEYGWGNWYKPYFKDALGTVHYLYETCNLTEILQIPANFPPEIV